VSGHSGAMDFKAACLQMTSGGNVSANIDQALELARSAVDAGAGFILLPEVCNLMEPDRARLLSQITDEADDMMLGQFRRFARANHVWVLLGSIVVKSGTKAANRSILIDGSGTIQARYDKMHLFDVDLGSEGYRESATYVAGSERVAQGTPWGKAGLSICYDLRFPGLYRKLAKNGASFLTVPSAFTRPTGAAHWHVLLRARAIENGCFVFAPAQTGVHDGGRETYGHSLIVDPWGQVLADGGEDTGVITADIDMGLVDQARRKIPSLGV